MKISRWYAAISTSATVMLFTIGMMTSLESDDYFLAAVFFFFAYATPLLYESSRDGLVKPDPHIHPQSDAGHGINAD